MSKENEMNEITEQQIAVRKLWLRTSPEDLWNLWESASEAVVALEEAGLETNHEMDKRMDRLGEMVKKIDKAFFIGPVYTKQPAVSEVEERIKSLNKEKIAQIRPTVGYKDDNVKLRVKREAVPTAQKFKPGCFVYIGNMEDEPYGPSWDQETYAQVEYTYAQGYGGPDVHIYSLLVKTKTGEWTSVSWYPEDILSLVANPKIVERLKKEIF